MLVTLLMSSFRCTSNVFMSIKLTQSYFVFNNKLRVFLVSLNLRNEKFKINSIKYMVYEYFISNLVSTDFHEIIRNSSNDIPTF